MSSIQPFFFLFFLLLFFALIRYWRRGERKPKFLTLALCGLFLFSWHPVAWLLLQPLQHPYPQKPVLDDNAQAIVVLASSLAYRSVEALPTPRVGSDTYERCEYAAWLYHHWRQLPILASGGKASDIPEEPTLAATMREALHKEGVPDNAIWIEEQSRSTHENAVRSAELLHRKGISRIVLVTDAYHMLRAEKSFRKQGLQISAAACGYRSFHSLFADIVLPGWEPVAFNEDSLHEYLGLVWYRLHGWI